MKTHYRNAVLILCTLVLLLSDVTGQRCNGGANCILLDQCTGLYQQLKQGNSPRLTSLLRGLHCGFVNEMPKICCPPEFLNGQTVDPLTLLPDNSVCGILSRYDDRIVGGEKTDIDEHIWMALLRYDKPGGWGFYCGGVLISERYVLTAAHCVKGSDLPTSFTLSQVRLGEWNTSSTTDCLNDDCSLPVQDIPIEEIIAHELYEPDDNNQFHDIALLRLSKKAKFHDFVKPICLPLNNRLRQGTFDDVDMEVAGWGKTENQEDSDQPGVADLSSTSGTESDVKLKVRIPVVNRRICGDVFGRVNREIIDKQICAGGVAGRDSCRGDSGGPLMGQPTLGSNWVVFGVVSYGPSPCGTIGWPGVYTRVGAYVDWILSKMRP